MTSDMDMWKGFATVKGCVKGQHVSPSLWTDKTLSESTTPAGLHTASQKLTQFLGYRYLNLQGQIY